METAIIVPIFKKGFATQVHNNNYRPISFKCIAAKLYESILKIQIMAYLTKYNLHHVVQYGFLPGHYVTTNLISALHVWTLAYDRKEHIEVVYVDFSKAFDVVSHTKFLYKRSALGIGGLVFDSKLRSFLSDRHQQVSLGNQLSKLTILTSGVTQGSVLVQYYL